MRSGLGCVFGAEKKRGEAADVIQMKM